MSAATGLRSLNLSNNSFRKLDAGGTQLSSLTQLTRLDLSRCILRHLPGAVTSLRRLAHLELGSSQLTALPVAPYVGAPPLLVWHAAGGYIRCVYAPLRLARRPG